jgi:hypothetical protein
LLLVMVASRARCAWISAGLSSAAPAELVLVVLTSGTLRGCSMAGL